MADDDASLDAQVLKQRLGVLVMAERSVRWRRLAEAAHVVGDHMKMMLQNIDNRIPHTARVGVTVHENDSGVMRLTMAGDRQFHVA